MISPYTATNHVTRFVRAALGFVATPSPDASIPVFLFRARSPEKTCKHCLGWGRKYLHEATRAASSTESLFATKGAYRQLCSSNRILILFEDRRYSSVSFTPSCEEARLRTTNRRPRPSWREDPHRCPDLHLTQRRDIFHDTGPCRLRSMFLPA